MGFKINRKIKTNVSTQLFEILRENILQNNWKENAKFFSIRQVSIKYEVNPNTVLKVFQNLEEQGYLYSIKGKGSFIKKGYNLSVNERMTPILNTFRYGQNQNAAEINLSNGAPPQEYFPVDEYKKIVNEILSDSSESKKYFGYQEIQGTQELRKELVNFVSRYGIRTTKEDIIICSGTQSVLNLIGTTFSNIPKKTLLLSNPTYQNAVHILSNFCNVENIELYSDGWDMNEFEEILKKKKIDFIYIMTNFQNPTGMCWSLENKRKLLQFSTKYDFYIIEDECFSDFYYDEQKVMSLKAMDKKERVFYVKTFSKIIMPGIALAMLIPPKDFLSKLSINKYFIDTTTSGLNQKVLELFLKYGILDRHLDNLRKILSFKMKYVIEKIKKIPHLEIINIPKGGFFLWIKLANYIDGEKFYYKCRLQGISILPGFIFYSNECSCCKIRISIVSASIKEIDIAFQVIKDILLACDGIPNQKVLSI